MHQKEISSLYEQIIQEKQHWTETGDEFEILRKNIQEATDKDIGQESLEQILGNLDDKILEAIDSENEGYMYSQLTELIVNLLNDENYFNKIYALNQNIADKINRSRFA